MTGLTTPGKLESYGALFMHANRAIWVRSLIQMPIGSPAMSEQKLTLKEMCAKFDVTPRTLRYYEYIELLEPEREGRTRYYGSRERARMTLILRGRKWGFSLEDIRQWLLIYEHEGTEAQMRSLIELADRQLEALAEQHRQLADAMVELREMRDTVARDLDGT